jgi:ribosomal protein S18 acetylase RimI-like enzyme
VTSAASRWRRFDGWRLDSIAVVRGIRDDAAMAPQAADTAIRLWEERDREHVQALLKLLSEDALVRSEGAPTYVAETRGRVVGMVTLCFFRTLTGPKAYLDHLVVAPECRRRGIGRALVEYAIEEAKAAGAARIDLTANAHKKAGRALYRSLGFHERDTTSFRLNLGSKPLAGDVDRSDSGRPSSPIAPTSSGNYNRGGRRPDSGAG